MQPTHEITLAIIGGSGLASLPGMEVVGVEKGLHTPYGDPSGPLIRGRLHDKEILFLARHGTGHTIPPHRVNYRANLWALKELGAHRVLAVNAVGGIHPDLGPGRIAIPEQIIDYTYGRAHTYFEGILEGESIVQGLGEIQVKHVDFTEPYCAALRARLLFAAGMSGLDAYFGGTYGATQGPRLESKAEIDRLERDGCQMVGMTGMPEAGLAQELGLCYACYAVVANWAAGRGGGAPIELTDIERVLQDAMREVHALVEALLRRL